MDTLRNSGIGPCMVSLDMAALEHGDPFAGFALPIGQATIPPERASVAPTASLDGTGGQSMGSTSMERLVAIMTQDMAVFGGGVGEDELSPRRGGYDRPLDFFA